MSNLGLDVQNVKTHGVHLFDQAAALVASSVELDEHVTVQSVDLLNLTMGK